MRELVQEAEPEVIETIMPDRHPHDRNPIDGPKRGSIEMGFRKMGRDHQRNPMLGQFFPCEPRAFVESAETRHLPQESEVDGSGLVDALEVGAPCLAEDVKTSRLQGMDVRPRICTRSAALPEEGFGKRIGATRTGNELLHDLFRAVLEVRRLLDPTSFRHFRDREAVEIDPCRRCGQPSAIPDQDFRRNSKMCVKRSDHLQGQIAFPAQHFGCLGSATEDWSQIALGHIELLHPEPDRLDGIGRIHRKMPILVNLDEGHEHVKLVVLGPGAVGSHQSLDTGESVGMIPFGTNWPNSIVVHHHTSSASIWSYSSRVPKNRTNPIPFP